MFKRSVVTHPLNVALVVAPHGDVLVPPEEVRHQLGPVPVQLGLAAGHLAVVEAPPVERVPVTLLVHVGPDHVVLLHVAPELGAVDKNWRWNFYYLTFSQRYYSISLLNNNFNYELILAHLSKNILSQMAQR